MFFNKIPPAANFRYQSENAALLSAAAGDRYTPHIDNLGEGVFRFTVQNSGWEAKSQALLDTGVFKSSDIPAELVLTKDGDLQLDFGGATLLSSLAGGAFGVLGKKWILRFDYDESMRFYGLGEKHTGLEKTGQICKFWNTDVFADFGFLRAEHGQTDPLYASIPYLLLKQDEGYVGILVNNPYPVFMNLGAEENIANLMDANEADTRKLLLGSYDGTPDVFFIVGTNAKEVTRKLQRLCGMTPMPPIWALGNHQCRFGYRDLADLEELDAKFDEYEIPCDGLWLDIDYMDGFRVFTVNDGFEDYTRRIGKLQEKGRKIVPILDPGVKNEAGFSIFESGQEDDVFCKTCEGDLYSGFVWPGRTAFPDYSINRARAWWAWHVKQFTETYSFDGYWIDMNDPSTGSAELEDMRFNEGKDDHNAYHNQYALGMQEATLEGLSAARPGERPFIISRSGFISTQRYSALWTGDNWSNYTHLREGIGMSLNLSLSGVPFNGPDVPGFCGEVTPELAVDWHKAGFLFPFFRNHSANLSPKQEPWQFEKPYREVIAHYIRLRYKLLPYLYNCFFEHAETGDPILRTLFYEFPEDARLEKVADQFLVGDAILQAPIVNEGELSREVVLPDRAWFNATNGTWSQGERQFSLDADLFSTGLFFAENVMLPALPGIRKTIDKHLNEIEVHVMLSPDSTDTAKLHYRFDDGVSVSNEAPQSVSLSAVVVNGNLNIQVESLNLKEAFSVCFVTYARFEKLSITSNGETIECAQQECSQVWSGAALPTMLSEVIEVSSAGKLDVSAQPECVHA